MAQLHNVSIGRNINHHIEIKSQLEEWANYDSLTSIFNRRYGEHLLEIPFKKTCAMKITLAACYWLISIALKPLMILMVMH